MQSVDSTLGQLAHRKQTLPQHAQIAELNQQRSQLERRRVELETQVSDHTREQRRIDADVEQVRARRERTQLRLDTGAVGSPKELEGLQHELVALNRRISSLENEELEFMEQLETEQAELDSVRAGLQEVDQRVGVLASERDLAAGDIDVAVQQHLDERARLVGSLPEQLVTAYEKSRAQHGGIGAAALVRRACEGCRLELNAGDMGELTRSPIEEVLRCPECGRILVRTPESSR
ncbi:MAG: C4-type zinc ribbon domain-containing protein [Actinomycetota bacterium]|nr:C4-type zinc ribbon domain-containing protein [Actinomycetota bacterium]